MAKATVRKLTGSYSDTVRLEGKGGDWAPTGWAVMMGNTVIAFSDNKARHHIYRQKGTAQAIADALNS